MLVVGGVGAFLIVVGAFWQEDIVPRDMRMKIVKRKNKVVVKISGWGRGDSLTNTIHFYTIKMYSK